jgi:hypothetical protein
MKTMNKKRLRHKVKKLQIRNRILRSDLLIEKENREYETSLFEAQINLLTRDNKKWKRIIAKLEEKENTSSFLSSRDIDEMIAAQERPTKKLPPLEEDPTPIPAPPIDDLQTEEFNRLHFRSIGRR